MRRLLVLALLAFFAFASVAAAAPGLTAVHVWEFDPFDSNLVESEWINHIGCPTGAKSYSFDGSSTTVVDEGCPVNGRGDGNVQGLLLAKTGPTTNYAAAGAKLAGVSGLVVTELGYDIRKFGGYTSPYGSHCGAGAPRFNVVTDFGLHFIGCASPPPVQVATGMGWTRLKWTTDQAFPPVPAGAEVRGIDIVFDEGQDPSGGPEQLGMAILDNINVNGTIVGRR